MKSGLRILAVLAALFLGTSSSVVYAASSSPVTVLSGTSCTLTKFDPVFQAGTGMVGTVAINCSGEFIIETGVYAYLSRNNEPLNPVFVRICPGSTYCQVDAVQPYSHALWHTWGKGYAKTRDGKKQWYPNTGAYQRSVHCVQT